MYLNLHAHTLYSDGSDTIKELAKVYKAQDHAALIITDHDDIHFRPVPWKAMLNDAETTSNEMDGYPILVGLEIFVPGAGHECLLFGHRACSEWVDILVDIQDVNRSFFRLPEFKAWVRSLNDRNIEYALILCHPSLSCIDSSFYALMHGYEIMNAGQMCTEDMIERMKLLMPKAKPFKNIDLHCISYINPEMFPCNEITEDEAKALFIPYDHAGNMSRLIKWIKS